MKNFSASLPASTLVRAGRFQVVTNASATPGDGKFSPARSDILHLCCCYRSCKAGTNDARSACKPTHLKSDSRVVIRLADGQKPCKIDLTYQTHRPSLCACYCFGRRYSGLAFVVAEIRGIRPDSGLPQRLLAGIDANCVVVNSRYSNSLSKKIGVLATLMVDHPSYADAQSTDRAKRLGSCCMETVRSPPSAT